MSSAFVSRGTAWLLALAAVLIGVALATPDVGASVALAPGASGVVIFGTTAAREPDLSGVVLFDNSTDFEIRDFLGTVIFSGKLQNRVVRSDRTGRMHFYYRIRDTSPGLRGSIVKLVTGDFAGTVATAGGRGLSVSVDFRTDGLGNKPDRLICARSSDGALISFQAASGGLRGPEESPSLFIKTDALGYRTGGETTIEAMVPIVGTPRTAIFKTSIATVQPAP